MNSEVDAYPLYWPAGWPTTPQPQRAAFDTPFSVARDELAATLADYKRGDTDEV